MFGLRENEHFSFTNAWHGSVQDSHKGIGPDKSINFIYISFEFIFISRNWLSSVIPLKYVQVECRQFKNIPVVGVSSTLHGACRKPLNSSSKICQCLTCIRGLDFYGRAGTTFTAFPLEIKKM